MRDLSSRFKNKTIDFNKLIQYGFTKIDNQYIYKTTICDGLFEMIVIISNDSKTSKLIDAMNDEEYIMADIQDSVGEFVGKVRQEYENKLNDIINKCTYKDVFKSKQAKEVIEYIKNKYNDDLEFLWEKFDDNAIWRNKKNNKWYGLLVTLSERKIGIESDKVINMIIIRYQPENIENIVDNKLIYPGYHMNKRSWITIKLDDTMEIEKIYRYIDNSYDISIKK